MAEYVGTVARYRPSNFLDSAIPSDTNTPPAQAWRQRTGVLGTKWYSAAMAAASTSTSRELKPHCTAWGSACTSPLEAETTYDVVATLMPSSSGPKVSTPQ